MSFKYFFKIISYFRDMRTNSTLESIATPGLALSTQKTNQK